MFWWVNGEIWIYGFSPWWLTYQRRFHKHAIYSRCIFFDEHQLFVCIYSFIFFSPFLSSFNLMVISFDNVQRKYFPLDCFTSLFVTVICRENTINVNNRRLNSIWVVFFKNQSAFQPSFQAEQTTNVAPRSSQTVQLSYGWEDRIQKLTGAPEDQQRRQKFISILLLWEWLSVTSV